MCVSRTLLLARVELACGGSGGESERLQCWNHVIAAAAERSLGFERANTTAGKRERSEPPPRTLVEKEKAKKIERERGRERKRRKGSNMRPDKDGRLTEDTTLHREKQRAGGTGMQTELSKKVGRGEMELRRRMEQESDKSRKWKRNGAG